jgi:hypothetical protein
VITTGGDEVQESAAVIAMQAPGHSNMLDIKRRQRCDGRTSLTQAM